MRLCMLSSFHQTGILCKFEIIVIKNSGTSCTKWAIPIEISGFLCETTTLERQHVILKSFKPPIFYVFSNGHSHWVPKIQTSLASFDIYDVPGESVSSKTTLQMKINSNGL